MGDLNTLIRNLLNEQGVDKAYNGCDVRNDLIESKDADKRLLQLRTDCQLIAAKVLQLMCQNWKLNEDELEIVSRAYKICSIIESIANYPLNEKQGSVLSDSFIELNIISSRLTVAANKRIQ